MDVVKDIFSILASIVLLGLEAVLNYPAIGIPALLFLILAAIWRQTGRFPVIGFIVRLLYLPINLLASLLFGAGKIINAFLDLLDAFTPLKGLSFLLLVILGLENGYFFFLAAVLALLLRFGLETEPLREAMTYYPRARRQPEPRQKAVKPPPAPKAAAAVRNKPQPPAPPPVVQVAASLSGKHQRASQLISDLPPHLQALIAGAEPEATGGRKLPLLKLVLRSLLLAPLWLLAGLARPFMRGRKAQAEGEGESPAEAEPIASEASANE